MAGKIASATLLSGIFVPFATMICLFDPFFSSTVRERWENRDKRLINSLNDTNDYMAGVIDPILAPVIEKVILHRPRDVAKFISQSIAGKEPTAESSAIVQVRQLFPILCLFRSNTFLPSDSPPNNI
jgi:hypothetical protein